MADPGILDPGSAVPALFLRSGDCFDAPYIHIPYALIVRVENKIHIVNNAC